MKCRIPFALLMMVFVGVGPVDVFATEQGRDELVSEEQTAQEESGRESFNLSDHVFVPEIGEDDNDGVDDHFNQMIEDVGELISDENYEAENNDAWYLHAMAHVKKRWLFYVAGAVVAVPLMIWGAVLTGVGIGTKLADSDDEGPVIDTDSRHSQDDPIFSAMEIELLATMGSQGKSVQNRSAKQAEYQWEELVPGGEKVFISPGLFYAEGEAQNTSAFNARIDALGLAHNFKVISSMTSTLSNMIGMHVDVTYLSLPKGWEMRLLFPLVMAAVGDDQVGINMAYEVGIDMKPVDANRFDASGLGALDAETFEFVQNELEVVVTQLFKRYIASTDGVGEPVSINFVPLQALREKYTTMVVTSLNRVRKIRDELELFEDTLEETEKPFGPVVRDLIELADQHNCAPLKGLYQEEVVASVCEDLCNQAKSLVSKFKHEDYKTIKGLLEAASEYLSQRALDTRFLPVNMEIITPIFDVAPPFVLRVKEQTVPTEVLVDLSSPRKKAEVMLEQQLGNLLEAEDGDVLVESLGSSDDSSSEEDGDEVQQDEVQQGEEIIYGVLLADPSCEEESSEKTNSSTQAQGSMSDDEGYGSGEDGSHHSSDMDLEEKGEQ